jgi:hypothetical protein
LASTPENLKAGSPTTTPSKALGNFCVTIIASRPPIEQPSKYEYS